MFRTRCSAVPRLLAGYLLVGSAEWLLTVALSAALYDATGSPGWVAATVALRFVPSVLVTPYAGVLADRIDRRVIMVWSCALRAGAIVGLAAATAAGAAPILLLAIALVDAVLVTPYRPAAFALLPSLAGGRDLPRANAAMGVVMQVSCVVGPALGALATLVVSPAFAFALTSVLVAAAAACAATLGGATVPSVVSLEFPRSSHEMLRDGVVALRTAPGALSLVLLSLLVEGVFGFELVAHVSVAAQRLDLGPEGAGWLTAFAGVGGILGASLAARAASGRRAGVTVAGASAVFGVTLAVLAAITAPALAFGLLLIEGVANVLYDVLTLTLLQRLLAGSLLARGQALMDALGAVALVIGSLAAPFLIGLVGLQPALVVVGLGTIATALVLMVLLTAIDRDTMGRVEELAPVVERFRATALFAMAPYGTVERLAAAATPVAMGAAAVVVREGDPSECIYVVESGRLAVSMTAPGVSSPHVVNELGGGDWFGEIGVIRETTRTATVTALTDVRLWRIPAGELLAAVADAVGVADPLRRGVAGRLARTHPHLAEA